MFGIIRNVSRGSLCCRALCCAILVASAFVYSPPALAQEPGAVDLTGETCLSGSTDIDPDGEGPLPSFTYCLMLGNLGPDTALEMDDTDGAAPMAGSPNSVADANLFSGETANDPDLPFVMGLSYIDWNDLPITPLTGMNAAPLGSVEDHRILDWTANSDFTMLRPQAGSCLNNGSVVPKEDFTQSYIANNNDYLYFGQERRTNNGNSVYYWLLTQLPPVVVDSPDCGANTRGQLQFDLSTGDIEVIVNFPSSSDPAGGAVFFRLFSEPEPAVGYVPAKDAVFLTGWGPLAPVLNFSLNIAEPPHESDDGFGTWGGIDSHGDPVASGSYTTASFAEWAVDLLSVFDGAAICGQRLFVTGLSRAATGQVGALDEPSALKDVVGPKLYSFGEITAAATVTGNCSLGFDYSVSALGINGDPLALEDLSCEWTCTSGDGRVVTLDTTSCSGSGTIPRGDGSPDTVSCTVSILDTQSSCSDDASDAGDVLAPLEVSIAPDNTALMCTVPGSPGSDNGNIGPGVTYSATVGGGLAPYSYDWTVNGPNNSSCEADAATCNVDIPDGNFCALTELSVEVDDSSALCPADTSETEAVMKQTTVAASNNES